jgi:hypothetical protein
MERRFLAILGVIAAIFVGIFIFTQSSSEQKNSNTKKETIGVQHPEQTRDHITRGQTHAPYNSDPASSGPHYSDAGAPAPWGVYTEEVPEEVFIHNEEHGGIIITYSPKLLPADQLKKLQALVTPPYSDPDFEPNRALVTPRAKNTHAIQLASWRWTLNLDSYDEAKIKQFYLQHVNRAPEVGAGPHTTPINQAR